MLVEVRVLGGLEAEEFAAEGAGVDREGAPGRRTLGERFRKEVVVGSGGCSSL